MSRSYEYWIQQQEEPELTSNVHFGRHYESERMRREREERQWWESLTEAERLKYQQAEEEYQQWLKNNR